MINLLPAQQKKELLEEERWRLALVSGLLLLLFLASLFFILLSIKTYISGEVQSQKVLVELEEEKFGISEVQNIEQEIKLTNQNLSKLDSFYGGQANFTELLEKISKTLPDQIYFTTLSFSPIPKEKKILQISLGGRCETKDLLSEFKKRLESEPEFKEVDFPLSNWVKPEPIDFLITFKFDL